MNTTIEIAASTNALNDQKNLQQINATANFISLLFTRLFQGDNIDLDIIHIELIEDDADYPWNITYAQKEIYIWYLFDFQKFFELEKASYKAFMLDTLFAALEKMCNEFGYDLSPFREAYEQVKALNYQNEYIHGKLKTAPDRTHKAGVHIRVEEEHAVLSALVQDSEGNETTRIEILRTLPHYMFIYKFIHQTKWLDKDRFQISDKSGQVVFAINVQEQKAAMHLHPKNLSLPELMQEVAQAVADKSL